MKGGKNHEHMQDAVSSIADRGFRCLPFCAGSGFKGFPLDMQKSQDIEDMTPVR
jgi:hypothetical protein